LNSPLPLQRAYGARQLGEVDAGTPLAVQALLIALEDANYLVRGAAAESLGRLGADQAAPALIEIMQDRAEDREDRARNAEALGRLEAKEAVEPLIAALDDIVWRVRYQAAVALGRIGDSAAREALANAAQYDPDASARKAAQEALKRLN
jgi:HEAT repeat protein